MGSLYAMKGEKSLIKKCIARSKQNICLPFKITEYNSTSFELNTTGKAVFSSIIKESKKYNFGITPCCIKLHKPTIYLWKMSQETCCDFHVNHYWLVNG